MPKISELAAATALTDDDYLVLVDAPGGTPTTKRITAVNASSYFASAADFYVALSNDGPGATAITTGTAVITTRMLSGMTLTGVRAHLSTASSSGLVTVDININGTSILSTKLSIDAGEKTSTTAATPAVISTPGLWDDAELTFDIDAAGTGAKGLKVALIGTRATISPPAPPAGISFVASTNTTYAGGRTTTTVTKPTGTTDGDYVILGIFTGATTEAPDPTPPAGFTLIAGPVDATDGSFNVETRIYGKVASSEGASWAFTHSSASSQGFALTYRGVHATTQLDVSSTGNTGTGTTSTANGVTTVTNSAMLVFVEHDWGVNSADRTAPTGFTERIEVNPLMYVAEKIAATAGATGNVTFTNNNSGGSDAWGAALIALRPA